ncbi:MAG: DsrE family protein [Gammaproteobacteria bacterium]|nr:DsrE family protein [Gammaproteobacteria bacterium]
MNVIKNVILLTAIVGSSVHAGEAPWGTAKVHEMEYSPSKVVYDVSVNSKDELSGVLDRASYLNNIYHANPFETSIVLVMHGNGIPLMATENYDKNKELVTRAQSLTVGGTISIRMCEVAAKGHGFEPKDIHGFVEVVPMADAEIVRLQNEGYAYMQ